MKINQSLVIYSSIFAIFLGINLPGFSQQKKIDSLWYRLEKEKADTAKIKYYVELAWQYKNDSSALYLNKAFEIAEKYKYDTRKLYVLNRGFWLLYQNSNLSKALEYALLSFDIAATLKDTVSLLESYFRAYSLYVQLRDPAMMLEYTRKSETLINKSTLPDSMILVWKRRNIYNARAAAFAFMNRMDSSRYYRRMGYEVALRQKDTSSLLLSYAGIGTTFIDENPDSAIYYFHQAIPLTIKYNRVDILARISNGLARIYLWRQMPDSVRHYGMQAILYNRQRFNSRDEMEATNTLHQFYAGRNQMDSAYKYLLRSSILRDSIFGDDQIRAIQSINYNERTRIEKAAKDRFEAQQRSATNLKFLVLLVVIAGVSALVIVLVRNNRRKHKANLQLQQQKKEIDAQKNELQNTLETLKSTQSQLIHSEKMASLGELTAGIAHEIQNPLNFVNNFSEVSNELLDEMYAEIEKGEIDEAKAIAIDIKQNLEKINHHGKRADAIVKGMLQHSRSSSGVKEPTDINALADEYLRLAYHGLRAKDKSFNATLKTDFDENMGNINIIPQDIGRVILNLITNAFYVVHEKKKQNPAGYEATVSISTKKVDDLVIIKVVDNGNGIPQKILNKIFQPFFTTKPTGQGTGLGLSLSYDIVKAHGGEIKVESKEYDGTEFVIQLPIE